jgi:hypothetical protein
MRLNWRCRLRRTFFGLTSDYTEQVYEQFFLMKYYGGWSFIEVYNLPVGLRQWFFERLLNEKTKEKEAVEKANKKSTM